MFQDQGDLFLGVSVLYAPCLTVNIAILVLVRPIEFVLVARPSILQTVKIETCDVFMLVWVSSLGFQS